MHEESTVQHETLLGHPVGLYTVFFAEMWERFSYYGMRALLVLYMIKGFLSYNDETAYEVYGAYTALVYATPFIGGMFADRLLGARRAVVFGGLMMAVGHLLMTVQQVAMFYLALAFLIVGNGFFKPNISTMVGKLYPPGSPRRDGGFTIFYMGVNMGAALSPLLCGYIGETYGWHYGFGLATIGMLGGIAVFVAPIRITQFIILVGSIGTAGSLLFLQDSIYQYIANGFVGLALVVAAFIAFVALNRGGLPERAGRPPDSTALAQRIGPFRTDVLVYLGVMLTTPIFAFLVYQYWVAKIMLFLFGGLALLWLLIEATRRTKIERERLFVVMVLMIFSALFWIFFEQAGSSLNNFTDRNVDRVMQERVVATGDVGAEIRLRVPVQTKDESLASLPLLNQEQLGMTNGNPEMANQIAASIRAMDATKNKDLQLSPEKLSAFIDRVTGSGALTITGLTYLRDAAAQKNASPDLQTVTWKVTVDNVGMGVGGKEIPASLFQAANPIYILVFGVFFTMLWPFLAGRGLDPSTPFKFALGIFQLALGFAALWYGASLADSRGMMAIPWLLLCYLLHTTGELCSSPIGLSMVTKLSPKQIVSTVMGSWLLAMAFSNMLASEVAKRTGVGGEGEGLQAIPVPTETLHVYSHVYGQIAIAAMIATVICLALSPLLTRWMHREVESE